MAIILPPGNYFGVEKQCNENAFFRLNITQYKPDAHLREHYHENAYLSLLISGNYEEVNRHASDVIKPGEILFRPSGYSHANHFRHAGGRCLNIEFKQELLQQQDLLPLLPQKAVIYKAGAFEYLYRLLYAFSQDPQASMPALAEDYVFNWLAGHQQTAVPLRLRWLPQVKAILENEFDTHHTIPSLAARAYVHPVYLARAFKERTGFTVGEYQLKMRVRKAVELLFTTQLPVADIAFAAGFNDAPHLVRAFRFFYQVTPGKFRSTINS
ncbi:helix-turn-helix domain-containing protein [Chitinophaga vietnamensis]|uniref:helix-turn-helix domain-containing protein n=1 Tax=Chitinophaga vietnamensis TaxID=2593957 RepID=UPI0013757465|nr:AraC family transcriptional regulator [Chitinophaga vietnamensis]